MSINEPYSGLCNIYDQLMTKDQYAELVDFLESEMGQSSTCRSVLDIACGTGSVSLLLAERGYRVTGIDISHEMLHKARSKAMLSREIEFICADMRKFRMKRVFNAAVCLFDGFTYLLTDSDVEQAMTNVFMSLKNRGTFIMNTIVEKSTMMADRESHCIRGNGFMVIWTENYAPKTRVCQSDLVILLKERQGQNEISEFRERHVQKLHRIDHLKRIAQGVGFSVSKQVLDTDFGKPRSEARRQYLVLKKEF